VTDPRDHLDHRALAMRELQHGERLRWSGMSDPAVVFTAADGYLIPFSILWCGFAVYWESEAASYGAPVFSTLFGGVFVLIGLQLVAGRFLVKRHRKRTIAYAVTDRRAFLTNGRTTRETPLGRTDRTTRWSRDRSHCSVRWADTSRGSFFSSNRQNTWMYANTGMDGFFGPREMAFWDVRDGEALMNALNGPDLPPATGGRW
jgi:hypothetical protein